jgi:hypothetical protein
MPGLAFCGSIVAFAAAGAVTARYGALWGFVTFSSSLTMAAVAASLVAWVTGQRLDPANRRVRAAAAAGAACGIIANIVGRGRFW